MVLAESGGILEYDPFRVTSSRFAQRVREADVLNPRVGIDEALVENQGL